MADSMPALDKRINKILDDPDVSKNADRDRELEDLIRKSIDGANRVHTGRDGVGVLDLINQLAAQDRPSSRNTAANSLKALLTNVNDDSTLALMNDAMGSQRERINRYFNYDQIYEMMPEMAEAAEAQVHNILSPEEFNDSTLSVRPPIELGEQKSEDVSRKVKEIMEAFRIQENVFTMVLDGVVRGDLFMAVVDLEREIDQAFGKNDRLKLSSGHSAPFIGEEFEQSYQELLAEEGGNPNKAEGWPKEWGSDGQACMHDMAMEFNSMVVVNPKLTQSLLTKEAAGSLLDHHTVLKEGRHKGRRVIGATERFLLRKLPSERVVKVTAGEAVLGYYYIDFTDEAELGGQSYAALRQTGHFMNFYGRNASEGIGGRRVDFFADNLTRYISSKLDRKFIADNPQFRALIYSLVQSRKFLERQIVVEFLPPDDVVHFAPGGVVYGKSIYYKSLFVSKLYMMLVTSALLQKVVKGTDEKVYYVEYGLDNQFDEAITQVVRDIKSRNFTVDDLGDINSAIRITSPTKALYLPSFEGNKPVEVETFAGDEISVENEFMEFLRRSALSGTGVPESYIGVRQEVEFARSLTMQNGNFVRRTVRYQKEVEEFYSKLLYNLYTRLHPKDADVKETTIQAKFTPPSTLNSQNVNESMTTAIEIADKITETLVGEEDAELRRQLKIKILERRLPQIDWIEMNDLLREVQLEKKNEDIKEGKAGGAGEDELGGGDVGAEGGF